MLARLDESIAELWQTPPKIAKEELEESLAFLQWLKQNHLTFLGARDYAFDGAAGRLTPLHDTGLGLLRDPERRVIRRGQDRATMTPEVRAFMMQPSPLIVTKSLERSPVHRRVQEDYIGVKRFNASGELIGERRFIGLFTSTAYHDSPRRYSVPAPQGCERDGAVGVPEGKPQRKGALGRVGEPSARSRKTPGICASGTTRLPLRSAACSVPASSRLPLLTNMRRDCPPGVRQWA